MKYKETEIAEVVIAYLRNLQWEIHEEVQVFSGGPIADIVGVQGGISYVVETKTALGLPVIAQAQAWKSYANYVSVGVPYSGRYIRMAEDICRHYGIGVLYVFNNRDCNQRVRPRLNRYHRAWREMLLKAVESVPENYAAAGNADHNYYTAFRRTCDNLRRYLRENGPSVMRDVINSIDTHYATDSTAKACISKWARDGVIKGVVVKKIGGKLILQLEEQE